MSKMDSFFNLSPLNTTVSRKVISFSDISAVNLMVAWNLLAFSINRPFSLVHFVFPIQLVIILWRICPLFAH